MIDADATLPLSVLDFVGVEFGETAHQAIRGAVRVAQAAQAAGYRRYWVSEHHNMSNLACSAPELLVPHVAAHTDQIRVGAAGMMVPNHSSLKIAELFRTLVAMYPGRIDLALGRAPGTDPLTAHLLRRGVSADVASQFPAQVGELLAFLGDGFPAGHPYSGLIAAPVVSERPELFMLGSSGYGPQFAAINGLRAVFAHHMNPELAFDALRDYRRNFVADSGQSQPYSALSVLAFASDDEQAVVEFEAGWTLTIQNLGRGIREPLRPEQVRDFARSDAFRHLSRDRERMVTGAAKQVVERLLEMKERAEADELVIVTPGLSRELRIASYQALAEAWRLAS